MPYYTVLRLLLAAFLLYFAWPYIVQGGSILEKVFWLSWLSFLLLVIGGNLATGLRLSRPPVMEQEVQEQQRDQ